MESSTYKTPLEPQIGTHSAIAPAPFSFIVSPGSNGSHHSPHHSPAIGTYSFVSQFLLALEAYELSN